MGRLAAEHLLDRGLRHFGFVGYLDHAFSVGREEGFRETVEAAAAASSPFSRRIPRNAIRRASGNGTRICAAGSSNSPGRSVFLASHDPQGVELSRSAATAACVYPKRSPW